MNVSQYKTNFNDFKPEELKGKIVLYESGMSYDPKYSYKIRVIQSATKTQFKINTGTQERLYLESFDLQGYKKGLTGRQNMGVHSKCYLITEEQANEIAEGWNKDKQKRILFAEITANLPSCSFEQLEKIKAIIG